MLEQLTLRRATSAFGLAVAISIAWPAHANYQPLPEVAGVGPQIPAQVDADGTPLIYQNALHHRDYSAVMHAFASVGRIMRDSEMGHPDYATELAGDPMRRQGEAWLEVMQAAARMLMADRAGSLVHDGDAWVAGEPFALADLAHASFSYHMHHSAGRWSDLGLEDALTNDGTAYLSTMTRRLSLQHYDDGGFTDSDDTRDAASLSHGLDALHALAYSFVRWDKPGGADDMGQLTQGHMERVHGVTVARLVGVAESVAATLDEAWDDQIGAYDLGNGGTYSLDTLGSLLRGHKGLYEILVVFGDDTHEDTAAQLFERMAVMTEALAASETAVRDWGIADAVVFTGNGVEAASERVDTAAQWRFLNQLTGGFSMLRERDGTSAFLATRPELPAAVGTLSDRLLHAALDYQTDADGLMLRRVSLADGEVIDDRHQIASIGWFLTAAGNSYRAGADFERPGDWGDDKALAERSAALYDTIRTNNDQLLSLLN